MADSKLSPDDHIERSSASNVAEHAFHAPPQEATRFMLLFSLWMALSAWICNFDSGYGGIVLLMPSYNKAFGTCHMVPNTVAAGQFMEVCHVTPLQQSLISVTNIFISVGGILGGITGNYFGRRGTIQVGCTLILIGAAGMLGTSGNFTNYMVCKCIGGIGIGQLFAASPIYGAECVTASRRGMLLALYNIGLAMGNVAAAAVCAGSSNILGDWAWKTPIACQIPLSVIYGLGILMFPESPRWLLVNGREEAARKSFARFYNKDPASAAITAQVREVQAYIEIEKASGATAAWTEIFHRNDIRRTAISSLILIGLGITGIQFVVPYAALFLAGVGISNPFLINVIVALCIFAGTFIGPFTLDYGGRRWSMLVGYGGMAACMLIFSAVSTGLGSGSPTSKNVLVAFLCIWAFIFGGCIGSSVWLASAEMHSVRLRTYGQACTTMTYSAFAFACSFWTPYMLSASYGNMGTNVGYFYFGVTTAMLILTWLFVPETARLTLEQLDDYFASGRPAWRTSLARNKKIARMEESDRAVGGEKTEG
jgi:SP family sugar:H+ symporter-like MFS transporter